MTRSDKCSRKRSGAAWHVLKRAKNDLRFFVSQHFMGSAKWREDARNFAADSFTYANQSIPNKGHIKLHAARATFNITIYWGRSMEWIVTPAVIAGCTELNGYEFKRNLVIESVDSVKTLMKSMKGLVMSCNCNGNCASRRCKCVRKPQKCIGCGCYDYNCQSRVIVRIDNGGTDLQPQREGEVETGETKRGDAHPSTGHRNPDLLSCEIENDTSDDSQCESERESEINMHACADSQCDSESSSVGSCEHFIENCGD